MKRAFTKDLIRECHPPTPLVGLFRQSRDSEITKQHYREAKRKRDEVCFPTMLRTLSRNIQTYRLVQRLWVQTLYKYLNEDSSTPYLTSMILPYLTYQDPPQPPLYYSLYIENQLNWKSINLNIRFQQMSGRLVSLGYKPFVVPPFTIEDTEFHMLSDLWRWDFQSEIVFLSLYHELQRKGIRDKWRIFFSRLRHTPALNDGTCWKQKCERNHANFFLNECIEVNEHMTHEERQLLTNWVGYMKYPSCSLRGYLA